jgi:hypothetical protein
MNDQPQGTPQRSGEPGRQGTPEPDPCAPTPTPTPTPTPCPDPCDQEPPYGPPRIPAECCPDRGCCPEETGSDGGSDGSGSGETYSGGGASQQSGSQQSGSQQSGSQARGATGGTNGGTNGGTKKATCSWDEVDDPCIRATATKPTEDNKFKYTILTGKCESTNKDCTCEQWEWGGYPEGVCVPCKPCEGLIPTDGEEPGEDGCGEDGGGGECDSGELQRQLDALKKCNSSRQGAKAKLDAEIKAGQDREKELGTLVAGFDDIVKGYTDNRPKLVSREDTLKGFYRDTSKLFSDTKRYPEACLKELEDAINEELCLVEQIKCCQKNLEGKLERVTLLQQTKDDADKALKKAEDAFKAIKDLTKWTGDQFGALETLRDQILQALNDKDPQRYKWAFYLFYWKFVPQLCRRFPVPLCCGTAVIGCKHGDWHPSRIDGDLLKALICCAWRHVHDKKQEAQRAADALADVTRNLEYITTQVPDDKTLDTRIKTRLDKVACATAPATSR